MIVVFGLICGWSLLPLRLCGAASRFFFFFVLDVEAILDSYFDKVLCQVDPLQVLSEFLVVGCLLEEVLRVYFHLAFSLGLDDFGNTRVVALEVVLMGADPGFEFLEAPVFKLTHVPVLL
jgi:hypothetical protein